MPMDYDDNDVSYHNLQLAGEGRARSSSVLRPYDFPKFDFDDSLQGHLRFDSLVETEVFLGIQSHEDNQWIEDFSRGSNGMEFNSTPADSCPISSRNNVWSEATSSESVEMLLKSVGQEAMMPGASIIQESNATADQGTLSQLVESSNSKLKERNDAHGTTSDSTLPQDEVKNYLASSGHTEEQLKNPADALARDESLYENPAMLNQNSFCGSSGTFTDEGKHSYQVGSTSEVLEDSKTSLEKTMGDGDPLDFPSISDHVDSSFGMLSTLKACQQVNSSVSRESCIDDGHDKLVSSKTDLEDTVTLQGKTGVAINHDHSAGSSLGLVRDSDREGLESNLDSGRNPVDNLVMGKFELKSSAGDESNTSLTTSIQRKRPQNALVVSNDMDKSFDKCQSGSSMDVFVQHSAELSSSVSGDCESSEQLVDPTVQLSHKQDSGNFDDISVSPLNCKSASEMSLLSVEVNEASTLMGECYDKGVVAAAADHEHPDMFERCLHDTATGEDSVTRLQADDMNDTMQVDQDNLDHREANFTEGEKDMCKTTGADKERPGDAEHMDTKSIETPKRDHKTLGKLESAKEDSTFTSNKDCTSSAGHLEVGQIEAAAIGSHSDIDQNKVGMVDANLLTDVDNASKVVVSVINDSVQIPVSEMRTKFQQPVEKIDYSVPSLKDALDSSSLDFQKSSFEENADLASSGETMAEKDLEYGKTSDIDKTSCGSPTIISSSEPSQLVNDNQEEGRGYQITNEVKETQSTSEGLKNIDLLRDDGGFSFKVNASPGMINREPGKDWSPIPDVDKSKVLEETAPSSKVKTKKSLSTPRQKARLTDGESGPGTSKGTSERKGRRGSAKGTAKENVRKENQLKSPNPENASSKVERVSNSLGPPSSTSHLQFGLMQQHYGNAEATNKKPFGVDAVSACNLPDLNASAMGSSSTASTTPRCRQLFNDLQQVQLRAQIFVYGSLIQGHVPDEAFMVSAFAQYEGGRSFWEQAWRAAAERVQNQKSSSTAGETPRSQSGARVSDTVKQGSLSSKVSATPVSIANSKETPAAVLSPKVPLSSPLWNISTPRDSLPSNPMHKGPVDFQRTLTPVGPVHPYQTPPIRNYVSHTSLPSQTGFPGPWLTSPQASSFGANVRFRPVTMTETVKLTPVKDTSAVLTSVGKHTTSSPVVHAMSPSPALGEKSPIHDPKLIASAAQHSVEAKPRKRKKVPAPDPGQITFAYKPQKQSNVISNVASPPIIPVGASSPLVSDPIMSKPATDGSTFSPIELPKKSDMDTEKGISCSEETLSKVAEAKSQAEDAAALSSAAVTHCEDLWSQLIKQKDSGLTSETEARLASSAFAIAAAASVAKAAAAAARIACNAAVQVAELMADDILHSSDMHDTSVATPASIQKRISVTNQSGSIFFAAKEATKRRDEPPSAASKRAENLDAVVKAAELAAAAVSQAGKIVEMGEPFPLNDIIEAGPEGCWKLPQPSVVLTEKLLDRSIGQSGASSSDKADGITACIPSLYSVDNKGPGIAGKNNAHLTEGRDGLPNALASVGAMGSKDIVEKELSTSTDHEAYETLKSSRGIPEIGTSLRSSNFKNDSDDKATQAFDGIKEGSHIEVFNPRSAQKSAWYTANVLSVEKGKAYVRYNDLLSEKGSGNVQEWLTLANDGDQAPIIRTALGKRSRDALGDYVWSVGDRVDVWIHGCWCEGVVTEKDEKDETTLKVHLSVQGETQTVRAWNLRASRSWINGKWIEWSSSKGQNTSEQSDTRLKKRQKLNSPVSKSEIKEPNNLDSTLEKPEQIKPFSLLTSERTFNFDKTITIDDKKHASRRPMRTNQQKEGSRVVFGVPKPTGKKRKFMEVSKHFSTNKTETSNEANNSVKFAKYLRPQGAPPQRSKVPTRNGSRDKRTVESRPKVLSSRKTQQSHIEDSVSHEHNASDKSVDDGSGAPEEATEAPLSSLLSHTQSTASKRISSLNAQTARLTRGRMGPSGVKLGKIEDKVLSTNTGNSTHVSEPRRSNRRIQPTHRLLEGLQSSMAIPKMPSVSHDKSRRKLPARGK